MSKQKVSKMVPEEAGPYTWYHRLFEIVAILTLLILCADIVRKAMFVIEEVPSVWFLLFTLFCGILLADFASGFVHWMADNYGSPDMPFLGPNFVRPFREHHTDPKEITRHDFIETNGNSSIVSLPVLLPLWAYSFFMTGGKVELFIVLSLNFLLLFVFWTNQFHKWAHTKNPPKAVAFLQKIGLILSTPHHDIHHAPPHQSHYCITTGWLNVPLQKIRFFPMMEWLTLNVLGIEKSNHHDDEHEEPTE